MDTIRNVKATRQTMLRLAVRNITMKKLSAYILLLLITSSAHAVQITVSVLHARCGNDNGKVISSVSGGIPPYTYLWNTGSTANQLIGVGEGTYTVTVTDGLGETAQATGNVEQLFELTPTVGTLLQSACENSCSGIGEFYTVYLGGAAPYTVDHPTYSDSQFAYQIYGLCGGQQEITIADANGCPGTVSFYVADDPPGFPPVGAITPSCATEANGTITVDHFGTGQAWFRVEGGSIDSVYVLAGAPYVITGLPAGTYQVMYWDVFNNEPWGQLVYCTGSTEAVVGELSGPCGGVSGRVYHDAGQDCIFNEFDIPLPNRVLTIEPGSFHVITNGEGYYERALPTGSYTLTQPLDDMEQICPPEVPVPFTLTESNLAVTIDLANSSTVPHDIEIILGASAARPGFPTTVSIIVRNNSAYPAGNIVVALQYDPVLTDVMPAGAQWTMTGLAPYSHYVVMFEAMVPADIGLLGEVLTYTATVTNTTIEADLSNNTATITRTITGSYDPNDKAGTTNASSSGTLFHLDTDAWIDYTVRFQNTGTDSAFTVVISDTLDILLDIPSLDILGASHDFTPSFGEGRALVFTFNNILLPDSTTDLVGSQGFVSYRIKPVAVLMLGDVIENTAGIYFDFNPPIITNTTAHVVETGTGIVSHEAGVLMLMPNPVLDVLTVTAGGSEIIGRPQVLSLDGRSMDLPVQKNGAAFTIDVQGISAGTYVVRVEDRQGIRVGRFIKW
jgi:hypothetical protein